MGNTSQSETDRLQADLIKKLDWGNVDSWHSSMFTELSNKVFENTEVKLSPSTLKRFFGIIKYDGTPSITTLDALSQYLDYENWRAYKTTKQGKLTNLREGISQKFIYSIIGFFAALVFIIFIANRSQSPLDTQAVDIPFSSRVATNSYPNSVIFDFDLKEVHSDSIQIQQYWDPRKTIKIRNDQKQATGIYYFPGYFEAKLMIEGKIANKHDLFLRSNGWLGTIEYEPVPKYFKPISSSEKRLYYPMDMESEMAAIEDPISIIYHYINDLGDVSGDNFTINANIQNTFQEKWAVCQSARIYIIGTDGAMIIPFSKLGCSSDNNLMLNDVYLRGKENDLTAFGVDISKSTPIQIVNQEKTISISINNKKVYTKSYNETMGNIVGLRFKFLGLGEVESFELLDQNEIEVNF